MFQRYFLQKKDVPPKYHLVEIKYLGVIMKRRGQLFCLCDNASTQYTPAFAWQLSSVNMS